MVQLTLIDDRNKELVKENTKYYFKNMETRKKGFKQLLEKLVETKKFLEEMKRKHERFILVHDRDADGQSSGGIIRYLLKYELDVDFETTSTNRFDFDEIVKEYGRDNVFIFTDVGSGQIEMIRDAGIPLDKTVILDHHLKLNDVFAKYEVNPNVYGFNGTHEISGAGMAYLLTRLWGLVKLSQIAIVGATGDMQNTFYGLRGLNRLLILDGLTSKFVNVSVGLPIFGRETRPLFKSLQLMSEPRLFSSRKHVFGYLFNEVGLEYDQTVRPLNEISNDIITDKITGRSSTVEEVLQKSIYRMYIERSPILLKPFASIYITGENYILNSFPKGTPLRDSKEFSTLLNMINRNNKVDSIGVYITSFEYEKVLNEALSIQRKMRRVLAKSIQTIKEELDYRKQEKKFLVILDESDVVMPHSTGTILQMLIDDLTPLYNKPMLGFVKLDDGYKISLRESKILFLSNINLAVEVEKVARMVGGQGGGHSVACGAFVPEGQLDRFIRLLHKRLLQQAIEKHVFFT